MPIAMFSQRASDPPVLKFFKSLDAIRNEIPMMDDCLKKDALTSHPSSGSITSSAATPLDSDGESDDSDYGLYEDFEELSGAFSSSPPITSTSSTISLQQLYSTHTHSTKKQDSSRIVLYTVKNSHAHISCRSFDKSSTKPYQNTSVCISMTGVRIVQDSIGLHPEFHVKMTFGLQEYAAWKTLNEFKEVAKACLEFSSRKKKFIWPSIFFTPQKKETRYRTSRSTRLRKTILAWENVVIVTSRRSWFGQLSVTSLMAESNALEHFLESLLFEIPDVEILLEFLREQ